MAPSEAASSTRRRSGPPPIGRVLVPVALGLGLLGWMIELGQRRPRAVVDDPGGPLVQVPAPEGR